MEDPNSRAARANARAAIKDAAPSKKVPTNKRIKLAKATVAAQAAVTVKSAAHANDTAITNDKATTTNEEVSTNDIAIARDKTITQDATNAIGTTESMVTHIDSDIPQDPLYAFARLVAGDDRAESWLGQEKERRARLRSNLANAMTAPTVSFKRLNMPHNEPNIPALGTQHDDQPLNKLVAPEYRDKSSKWSLVYPQKNELATTQPAKDYLDILGHDVDLSGHPFLNNQKSWAENCSILHNKVMELYRIAGCWTKHPWNKDNCTEISYATNPYPFNVPFAARPAHNSYFQGPEKPQSSCLTCIDVKRGCLPGAVANGRCLACQGGYAMTNEAIRRGDIRYEDAYDEKNQPKRPKMGGQFFANKQRTCYWEVPEYFINTYEVAHLFFGGRFRANNKGKPKPKPNIVLKLTKPSLSSGSQVHTDQPTISLTSDLSVTQDHAIGTVSETPGTPESASRLTDSSSPPSILQSSSPQISYPSSATSIHQHSHVFCDQTPPDSNLWSNDGLPDFDMIDESSLVSDGSLLLPSAIPLTPTITFNGDNVETLKPNLFGSDTSMQLTEENSNSNEHLLDPALFQSDNSMQVIEEMPAQDEHVMNVFDIEFERLEEVNLLAQSDTQESETALPFLTTDFMDVDASFEDSQILLQSEVDVDNTEDENTFFDFDA